MHKGTRAKLRYCFDVVRLMVREPVWAARLARWAVRLGYLRIACWVTGASFERLRQEARRRRGW
jgi:hypothetical protein